MNSFILFFFHYFARSFGRFFLFFLYQNILFDASLPFVCATFSYSICRSSSLVALPFVLTSFYDFVRAVTILVLSFFFCKRSRDSLTRIHAARKKKLKRKEILYFIFNSFRMQNDLTESYFIIWIDEVIRSNERTNENKYKQNRPDKRFNAIVSDAEERFFSCVSLRWLIFATSRAKKKKKRESFNSRIKSSSSLRYVRIIPCDRIDTLTSFGVLS